MKLWDQKIHDNQHWLASLAGLIVGLGIFLTYYFFSRIESQCYTQHAVGAHGQAVQQYYPWEMPWYYFVVGIFLCMTTASAIACMLSVGIRPRMK
jgi:hypothetical protein